MSRPGRSRARGKPLVAHAQLEVVSATGVPGLISPPLAALSGRHISPGPQLFLDAQELVVLGGAIGARERAGLDLPGFACVLNLCWTGQGQWLPLGAERGRLERQLVKLAACHIRGEAGTAPSGVAPCRPPGGAYQVLAACDVTREIEKRPAVQAVEQTEMIFAADDLECISPPSSCDLGALPFELFAFQSADGNA
jgi:hypothetical protein